MIQVFLYLFLFKIFLSETCNSFNNEYACGSSTVDWDNRCFQTPPKNSESYKETYQDMYYLVGYARLKYYSNKTICNITFITKINTEKLSLISTNFKILYKFGSIEQEENYIILNSENDIYPDGLNISAKIIDINTEIILASLVLEEEYLIWENPPIIQDNKIYDKGQKGTIVELFGWPFDDIAEECDILKVAGYLGVKITPPNEHVLTEDWIEEGGLNPWEYFIQPVSYKLNSRLGNKKKLKNMINKCRKKGIRIYSQIVINQMTYNGNDVYENHYEENHCSPNTRWKSKSSSDGSPFFTYLGRKELNEFSGKIPIFEYPAVPYCGTDFHCQSSYNSYEDLDSSWIKSSLIDLNTSKPYVQQRIADFLTELISIGISGFSIYNGKYISTDDYIQIFQKFKNNLGDEKLPDDFLAILELSFDNENEKEYFICDNIYKSFGYAFDEKLKQIFLDDDYKKIKLQIEADSFINVDHLCSVRTFENEKIIIIFENQNNQLYDENNINNLIQNKEQHKANYVNMYENTNIYSRIKIVFSSYTLINRGTGFPDGYSDCSSIGGCEKSVPYLKAYDPLSIGYDSGIEGNYSRIHRDLIIVNSMRKSINLTELSEDELFFEERAKVFGYPSTIPTTILTTFIEKTISTTIIETTKLTNIPSKPSDEIPNEPIIKISTIIETTKNGYEENTDTTISSEVKENLVEIIDDINTTYLNETIFENCDLKDYFNGICKIYMNDSEIITNDLLQNIESQILEGDLDDLLEDVINEEKKDYILDKNNIILEITSSYNQNNKKYNNISTLQLGDCEKILREKYNITEDQTLIILKIDYYEDGLLTPIIEYEIFHPITKEQLNLEYCNEAKISLIIPASIDEDSLLFYNFSSEYYTDKCYPYTTNNSTDITLNDRAKEYINNNLSLCESNCEYNGYDSKSKKVICECQAKENLNFLQDISTYKNVLLTKFKNIKDSLNINVIFCFSTLFTKNGFIKNIGNFILLSIIIYHLLSINFFVMKGYEIFKIKVTNLKNILQHNKVQSNKDDFKDKTPKVNNNNKINNIPNTINENEVLKEKNNLRSDTEIKVSTKKKIKIKKKIKVKIKKSKFGNNNNVLNTFITIVTKSNNIFEPKNMNNMNINNKLNKNDIISNSSKDIIELKNKVIEDNMNNYNDYELNNLSFEKAMEIDKRTYFQYYISLLKTKHLLISTFYNFNDYNSLIIKTCILLFCFSLYFTTNTLFYTDSTMHKIYEDKGKYNLIYRLPQILYSTIISILVNYLIRYLSLSEKNVLELKKVTKIENFKNQSISIYRCLNIKFTLYFNISLLLLFVFWFYVSCFCAVYRNTQWYLIKDTLISFTLSLVYPIFFNLLPAAIRIQALRESHNNRKCMYKFSKIIQLI